MAAHLSKCKNLQLVNFHLCKKLTDTAVEHLSKCSQIQGVVLGHEGANFTDVAASHLARCPELRYVMLDRCPGLTDDAAKHIVAGCPKIEGVSFHECTNLTDLAAQHLSECPQLKYVDLWLCESITDRAAEHLGKCSELIHAELRCTSATPTAVAHLANCLQLQHLGIEFNGRNTWDDFFMESDLDDLPAFPSLKSLGLNGCEELTDDDIELLAGQYPQLQDLRIALCKGFTNAAMERLAQCPDLRTVNLVYCDVLRRPRWINQAAQCLAKCPRLEPELHEDRKWKLASTSHWQKLRKARRTTRKNKAEGKQDGEKDGAAQPDKLGKRKGKGKKTTTKKTTAKKTTTTKTTTTT